MCFHVKSLTYYFYMKTKILPDFQICISLPLLAEVFVVNEIWANKLHAVHGGFRGSHQKTFFYGVSGTHNSMQKTKFSIKDFFSKCDQIRRKLRIRLHLLKKSLMENFIFCTSKLKQSKTEII